MPKRIYRVETKEGSGPYRAFWRYQPVKDDPKRHPEPDIDGLPDTSSRDKFAFSSLSQRDAWFSSKEQKRMSKRGLDTYAYDVPNKNIRKGGKQIAVRDLFTGNRLPTPKIITEE